jgi:hypothetical protein
MVSLAYFIIAFLKPIYKVLSAESCSGGNTQQPATAAAASQLNPSTHPQPINSSRPPSASLL